MKYVVFKTYIDLANRAYCHQISGNNKDQHNAGPRCFNAKAVRVYRDTLRVGGICTRVWIRESTKEVSRKGIRCCRLSISHDMGLEQFLLLWATQT